MTPKTTEILNASIASGNKLSKYGFKQAGGHPFNYREYVIAFNKDMKTADLAKFESNGLIQTLKAQTESLRVQYLEKVEGWAKREFAGYEKLAASPSPNYADFATPGFVKGIGLRFNRLHARQELPEGLRCSICRKEDR